MAHKKHTHYIVSQIERARIATFVLWQDVTLNLELVASLRLHLAMHVSLTVCKAFDLLGNREPLLLTDYATRFIHVGQKRHLMMLSQGSYEVYPADNVIFRVNISKARIIQQFISSLCIFLLGISQCFKRQSDFLAVTKELRAGLQILTKSFGKQW